MDNQFEELEKTAGEVDISECMALGNAKDMIALSLMVNVSNCIVEHLEFGDGFSESLNKVTNDVLDNLTSAQNEANKCFEDMSFKAIAEATLCASKVILFLLIFLFYFLNFYWENNEPSRWVEDRILRQMSTNNLMFGDDD